MIFEERVDERRRDLFDRPPFVDRLLDDLVFDVGDVHHLGDPKARADLIVRDAGDPPTRTRGNSRCGQSRKPSARTYTSSDVARLERLEGLHLAGQRVVDLHVRLRSFERNIVPTERSGPANALHRRNPAGHGTAAIERPPATHAPPARILDSQKRSRPERGGLQTENRTVRCGASAIRRKGAFRAATVGRTRGARRRRR